MSVCVYICKKLVIFKITYVCLLCGLRRIYFVKGVKVVYNIYFYYIIMNIKIAPFFFLRFFDKKKYVRDR